MSLLVTLRVYGFSEQCKRGEQNNNKQDVFAGVHSFNLQSRRMKRELKQRFLEDTKLRVAQCREESPLYM